MNDSGSSLVLAIGGGSVLDMAKLIRFFFSYSGDKTGNSFRKEQDLTSVELCCLQRREQVVKQPILPFYIKINIKYYCCS